MGESEAETGTKLGRPVDETKEEILSSGLTRGQWEAIQYEAKRRNPKVTGVQVLREAVVHYLDFLDKERSGTADDARKQLIQPE